MRVRFLVLLLLASFLCGGDSQQPTSRAAEPGRGQPPKMNRLMDMVKPGEPVPSPITFSSNFERIVLVRMTYETDVLEALNKAVEREKIKSAAILSGAGSLKSYHVHVVSNTTFPSQNVFFKGEGPYDLTAVNGYVVGGRVHAHVTFSDDKHTLAGHLEPGTKAFTFAVVTLGVFGEEVDLQGLDDKNWK